MLYIYIYTTFYSNKYILFALVSQYIGTSTGTYKCLSGIFCRACLNSVHSLDHLLCYIWDCVCPPCPLLMFVIIFVVHLITIIKSLGCNTENVSVPMPFHENRLYLVSFQPGGVFCPRWLQLPPDHSQYLLAIDGAAFTAGYRHGDAQAAVNRTP